MRSLRGAAAPLSRLRRVRAQEDETILFRSVYPSPGRVRFVHLDPPGLIRPREIGRSSAPCSGGLEDSSLHQNASRRILPERNHVVDNVAQAASNFVLILS